MAGHWFQGAGRAWGTTHADSAPHRAKPPKRIAKTNGAMRNPMAPIDKHSVMTKVGAHVCGCKVALLNARDEWYCFARWHQVVFVKRQAPPACTPWSGSRHDLGGGTGMSMAMVSPIGGARQAHRNLRKLTSTSSSKFVV